MPKKSKSRLTRREFIKTSAAGAGAVAIAGLGTGAAQAAVPPEKWDKAADIVIAGYGCSAAAAIEAHDAGAEVLILEKESDPGGCTAISGGMFNLGGGTPLQKACGVEETREEYLAFLLAERQGQAQEELQEIHADLAVPLYEWLTQFLGLEFKQIKAPWECSTLAPGLHHLGDYGLRCMGHEYYPPIARQVAPKFHAHCQPGLGQGLFSAMRKKVDERGIETLMDTPVRDLVIGSDGVVLGVKAERQGKPFYVRARKAVVLGTGGYGGNKDLVKGLPRNYYDKWYGVPQNQGDGIIMAQKAGAFFYACDGASFLVPNGPAPNVTNPKGPEYQRCLWINSNGRRFGNEENHLSVSSIIGFEDALEVKMWGYCIYDEEARALNHIDVQKRVRTFTLPDGHKITSKVVSGETLEDLAKAAAEIDPNGMGINPGGLNATVNAWNESILAGKGDPEYTRKYGLKPIRKPPYYACLLWPSMVNEATGIKINAKAQVVDVMGDTIPRLYALGRVTGGQYGQLYSCGTALSTGLIMARIAGKAAAAEKPPA